jgi:hypothetical protein
MCVRVRILLSTAWYWTRGGYATTRAHAPLPCSISSRLAVRARISPRMASSWAVGVVALREGEWDESEDTWGPATTLPLGTLQVGQLLLGGPLAGGDGLGLGLHPRIKGGEEGGHGAAQVHARQSIGRGLTE